MSPVKGITVQDLDGDGAMDLVLAGNDFGTEVETSRYDAGNGCVLLGKGKGQFRTLNVLESGFFAAGDARRLAKVRLPGGNTGVIVANNNGPAQLFRLKNKARVQ
jgi:hypothetical protein